jgi:CheY-like chemotaxis protein
MSTLTRSKRKGSALAETVLFVDPDILVRMVVADYLRRCGYAVIEALSAAEALKILRAGIKVDALFSEVELDGDVDGFALAQMARQEFPGLEIVLASGPSLIAKKSGELCEETALPKPYHPHQLAKKLKRILEQRRPRS